MSKIGIVVADGQRARFLTLVFRQEPPAQRAAPELIETLVLINHEGSAPALATSSDCEGAAHIEAHRRQHESLRRFAQPLLAQIRLFIVDRGIEQLIFVAEPHLLGVARLELENEPLRGVRVTQLAADLSRHPSIAIPEILALRGLLPATCFPHAIQPLLNGVSSCPAPESSSQMAHAPVSSRSSHRTS